MEPTVIAAMITAGAVLLGAVVTAIVGPTVVDWIKRRTSSDSDSDSTHEPGPDNVIDEPVDPVAEAEGRLAEMPLEDVPDPAPLPQGSVMPLSINPLFVGREDKLKALAAILKAGATTARGQVPIAAVTGPGGIGRTQLASEFVHRYGQYFSGGVFWLSFADAEAIPAEVAACGGAGRMELRQDFHTLPLEDQVRQVMSAWQSALPRLLVFVNCEDEELLERWRPSMGGCRMLLTSHRETWNPRLGVRIVALDILRREESVALLRSHCPDLSGDDPALDAIADELGDLPLALELAGSHLAKYRRIVSPADYLAQLRSRGLVDVAGTSAVSYDKLDTKDPIDVLALALLARAALFAPGRPIPRELLVKTLTLSEEDPEALLRVEDALVRLAELGMLQEQEAGTLRMHRLVATFVHDVVVEKERPSDIEEAQKVVEEALTDTVGPIIEEGYPAPLLELLPHLRVVTDAAAGREDKRAALLCNQLGRCLGMIGIYGEARPYLERALAIRKKVYGDEEHPDIASSLNNLGNVLEYQGKYEEARSFYERALAIRERLLGEEHRDTANTLNNLGNVLETQGEYEKARSFYERALAIRERLLGEEHRGTADTLNNLGILLQGQGEYQAARSLYERALAIYEKVYSDGEHPVTASILNNLATVLDDQGKYEEARPLYERALAIREKVYGEEHPHTASSLNNVGLVLQDQGKYEEARRLHERALAIYERVYDDEEHPDIASTLIDLGGVLQNQSKYEEARALYERALAIRKKVYGEEHRDTASTLNDLGNVLQNQGKYEGARSFYERALAIYEKVYSDGEHPVTASILNNLATVLDDQGKYEEARPLYERALAIREKVYGDGEHPNIASTLSNLGNVLQDQGKYEEARRLHERALAIYERVYGDEEHPNIASSLNDLGLVLEYQGKYEEARSFYERALALYEKVLGGEHRHTAMVHRNLDIVLRKQDNYEETRRYLE